MSADIDRSADFYEKVFGGRIMSRGDGKGVSGHIQIANTWLIPDARPGCDADLNAERTDAARPRERHGKQPGDS